MSGPSDKAVEVSRRHYKHALAAGLGRLSQATDAFEDGLRCAHDPALGLDRSVCVRDVVEDFIALSKSDWSDGGGKEAAWAADRIERVFGAGS